MSTHQNLPVPAGFVPDVPIVRKQTYASPMSYIGITRRTAAWVRHAGVNPAAALVAWTVAGSFLAAMYLFLIGWYVITVLIFGWLVFPFRMIRRSHRRQEHLQRQQLATMQAMLVQQQLALQANTLGHATQP